MPIPSQTAIPEKPCTVTVRCKACDVEGVRAAYLRGSKVVILFADGRAFEDILAVLIGGQWHDVDTVEKNPSSESYVVRLQW